MRRHLSFIVQILILASAGQISVMSARAESPRPTTSLPPIKCMGVSSAWTTDDAKTMNYPAKAPMNTASAANYLGHAEASVRDAQGRNQQQSLEAVLDRWQKGAKSFCITAAPRLTAFANWAMKRLGIGSAPPAPNLVSAPKSTIRVNVQTVTSKHPVWLLPDGRLKTVAQQ